MKDDRSPEEELGQNKVKTEETGAGATAAAVELPVCACDEDLLVALPPELRPSPARGKDVLHKFTCPGCGRVYLTNAMNDLCLDCQEKGVPPPGPGVTSQG